MATNTRVIVVDMQALEFMSASTFNEIVSWLWLVQDLPPEQRYQLHFRPNAKSHWQRRSLRTLSCFATDLIWQLVPPATPAPAGCKVIDIADTLGLGATSAGTPVWFRRDNHDVVLLVERNPVPAQVRRIVPTPASAIGEIVVIDTLEALLLRPDRL